MSKTQKQLETEQRNRIRRLETEKRNLVRRYARSRRISVETAEAELQATVSPSAAPAAAPTAAQSGIDHAEMQAILTVAEKNKIPFAEALKYSRPGTSVKAAERDAHGNLTKEGLATVQQRMREAQARGENPSFEDCMY